MASQRRTVPPLSQLIAWAFAICRVKPNLRFTALRRNENDRLAVGHQTGLAEAARLVFVHLGESALFDWRNENAPAVRQYDAIAVRREMYRGEILNGIFDPVFAEIIEIRR